jgi:hypothetical protein
VQAHLDREYGDGKYNVLGCEGDDLFDDPGRTIKCGVSKAGGGVADEWSITVELDGDEIRRVEGMEGRSK